MLDKPIRLENTMQYNMCYTQHTNLCTTSSDKFADTIQGQCQCAEPYQWNENNRAIKCACARYCIVYE